MVPRDWPSATLGVQTQLCWVLQTKGMVLAWIRTFPSSSLQGDATLEGCAALGFLDATVIPETKDPGSRNGADDAIKIIIS